MTSKYKILVSLFSTVVCIFFLFNLQTHTTNLEPRHKVITAFFKPKEYVELLGQSRLSKVWGSPLHSYAIKVGRGLYANHREHFMLVRAQLALEQYDPEKTFRKRAAFVKPLHHYVQNEMQDSVLVSERIYPLDGERLLTPLFLKDEYDGIESIVNKYPPASPILTNMQQLCYDLGRLVAILQLGAKIDGYDFEFFLGRDVKDGKGYKIYLLDFEKVRGVRGKFSRREKNRLVHAFGVALEEKHYAYFPAPSSKGSNYFWQGYFDFAAQLSRETNDDLYFVVAQKLFGHFIQHHPSLK